MEEKCLCGKELTMFEFLSCHMCAAKFQEGQDDKVKNLTGEQTASAIWQIQNGAFLIWI